MKLIQHQNLSTNQASVEFANIPQTYNDLFLVMSLKFGLSTSFQFDDIAIQLNGSTGNVYSTQALRNREGAISAFRNSSTANFALVFGSTALGASNIFGAANLYIEDYKSSATKLMLANGVTETTNGQIIQSGISGGEYSPSSPISSIKIYSLNGTSAQAESTATLYGISAGNDGITVVS